MVAKQVDHAFGLASQPEDLAKFPVRVVGAADEADRSGHQGYRHHDEVAEAVGQQFQLEHQGLPHQGGPRAGFVVGHGLVTV
ncbi:hypothetical protein D3C83_84570 [compost metagenome]